MADVRRRIGGIRLRVVVGYVVLMAVALAITVLVSRQVLLTQLDRSIDAALVQEIDELRLLAEGLDPETGEPFGGDVEALFRTFLSRSVPADDEAYYSFIDGRPFLRSFEAPAALLDDVDLVDQWTSIAEPLRLDTTTELGDVRTLAVPLRSGDEVRGVFVVTFFPENERSDIATAVRVIALAGAAVLLLTALVAWSIAGGVLRPIRRMTEITQAVNDTDLSGRITVEGHDELADLGHTLNAMIERLERGFVVQRRFLDDVAHELRTPITIARGHLDVLGTDPAAVGDAEIDETVEIVRDELDRMSRYVDDLLVLAKAERPDFLRPEPVDLGELAVTLHQRMDGLAERRWVLDSAPTPGMSAAVFDPVRVEQAVLNLASNAVQHTGPGDEIGIGVARFAPNDHFPNDHFPNGRIELWVRDTGPGIDPDILETLFRRHIRGANSRETRREGMGIGLSIVDVIARAHGGSVDVHSRPGAGATFTITIPVEHTQETRP